MKLHELSTAQTNDATEADLEWEATLRQDAADGTLVTIGRQIKQEYEDGKTEAL